MTTSFLPGTILVGLLLVTPLGGQERPVRPEGWPDAATVLERFEAGDVRHLSVTAIQKCPDQNPYGDTLLLALLTERPTPDLVLRLSPYWSIALRDCGDPRIAAWFRERLVEHRHVPQLVRRITAALRASPSPENVAAIKRHVFDESVDEHDRSMELFALDHHWAWPEKMDLYFEAYGRTQRIPEPYGGNTFWNLISSPVADRFVRRSLETIERFPEGPNPARLLHRLAMHPEVEKSPCGEPRSKRRSRASRRTQRRASPRYWLRRLGRGGSTYAELWSRKQPARGGRRTQSAAINAS